MSTATFHVHHDPAEDIGKRERLGVRLLILADGSFVFGMIFSYLYLRNLNTNGAWTADGGHLMEPSTAWLTAAPFVIAAITHALGASAKQSFKLLSLIGFLVLCYGAYTQFNQIATMPFLNPDTEKLESAYASTWLLMGGANMFHYILTIFLALGLVIRAFRANVDAELEEWRMRTAQSWFSWTAFSAVACALTLMLS